MPGLCQKKFIMPNTQNNNTNELKIPDVSDSV